MNITRDSGFAADMGAFLIRLPLEKIVLLSWIVSEYDGLGFVKSEKYAEIPAEKTAGGRILSPKNALVSLFFPGNKREDVLELLEILGNECIDLEILSEKHPEPVSCPEENAMEESILEDIKTL